MSNTGANFEMTGILLGQEARKRKTPQEKIAIIQQTMEPGMNVSHVARLHGIQPSLLFKYIWKVASLPLLPERKLFLHRSWQPHSSRFGSYSAFWARRRWKLRSLKKPWSTVSRDMSVSFA